MCSTILQRAEERAMGRNAGGEELDLGIGITLKCRQESGMMQLDHKELRIDKRMSREWEGRCLRNKGETPSRPHAVDLRE